MSDEPQTIPPTTDDPNVPDSPGQRVRLAREKARLSIEELATLIRLPRATVEALERDDYDALQEPVFVRGYYRKCAKVLGIPEAPLLGAYQGRGAGPPLARPDRLSLSLGSDLGRSRHRSSHLTILAPTLAIVVCVALWFLYGQSRNPSPRSSALDLASTAGADRSFVTGPGIPITPLPQPGVSAMATWPESPVAIATGPETPPAAGALAEAPALSVTASETAAGPAPQTQLSRADPAKALVIDITSTSWARIEDTQGRVLLNRVLQAGERETLSGEPPYQVVIGYAPGVVMSFAGEPFDFKPFVTSTATARFSVPATP